jgi:hypothetical protein
MLYISVLRANPPARQPLHEKVTLDDNLDQPNLVPFAGGQILQQPSLFKRPRIAVEDVSTLTVGLRCPLEDDVREDIVTYQPAIFEVFLDLQPERRIGLPSRAESLQSRSRKPASL